MFFVFNYNFMQPWTNSTCNYFALVDYCLGVGVFFYLNFMPSALLTL